MELLAFPIFEIVGKNGPADPFRPEIQYVPIFAIISRFTHYALVSPKEAADAGVEFGILGEYLIIGTYSK